MKTIKIVTLCAVLSVTGISAQQIDTSLVEDYFAARANYSSNELMVRAAFALLNTPYVAHTLEGNAEETLVVNLRELDCMTFVENCVALSTAAQEPQPDYERFVRQLQKIRYRDGVISGYTSRLHYTTDWIFNNAHKGIIEDVTAALGGKPFQVRVGFMSAHPESYSSLQHNPVDTEKMAAIENAINQRNTYSYIPKNEIRKRQSQIKSGDIVGFTTGIPGLDISHVGIAYWHNGQLSFIHASTKANKVVINPEPLVDYCKAIKTNTGIVVLRVK
ncbi:xylanase [Bacteroidia bacterium]|nr:xylanase [Bacteroidia bacterium]